jgi:type I restriction enzyme S subunit
MSARQNTEIGIAWYYYTISIKENIIENMAEGATNQKELPRTRLRSLEMLLPPHSIRTAFEEVIIPLKKQMTILQKSNDKLRQTRDLLLPKLMSGEIAI